MLQPWKGVIICLTAITIKFTNSMTEKINETGHAIEGAGEGQESGPVSPTIDLAAREIADLIEGNKRLAKSQTGEDKKRLPKAGYEREIKDQDLKIRKLEKKLLDRDEDKENIRGELEMAKMKKSEMGARHGSFERAQTIKEVDNFDFAFDTVLNAYEIAGNPFKYSKSALEDAVKGELGRRERERIEETRRENDKDTQKLEEETILRVREELGAVEAEFNGVVKKIEDSISPDTPEGKILRDSIQKKQEEIKGLMSRQGSWYQSRKAKQRIRDNAEWEANVVRTSLRETVNVIIREVQDAAYKVRTTVADLEHGVRKEGAPGGFFRIGKREYYNDEKIREIMDKRHGELVDQAEKLRAKSIQEQERIGSILSALIETKE